MMMYEIDMFCELHIWAIHKLQWVGGGARTGVYAGAKMMDKGV